MRRVIAVVPEEEHHAIGELLHGLGDVQAEVLTTLEAVDLDRVDVLWVHSLRGAVPGLRSWLESGGRLLATLDAAWFPTDLGLEPFPPNDSRSAVWHDDEDELPPEDFESFTAVPRLRGLAAFGPHPLFEQLDQGIFTWAPTEEETYRWVTYDRVRPGAGVVVAVERAFARLNADRAVVWEYRLGDGGILCIGAFLHPTARNRRFSRQLRALLRNVVAGQAIPHRERPSGVRGWPAPGRAALLGDFRTVPSTPPIEGHWGASPAPLVIEAAIEHDAPWTLAGRRGFMVGREGHGIDEAWLHPFRILRDAELRVDGEALAAGSIRVTPDQVERAVTIDRGTLIERWSTALEVPVLLWAVEGPEDVPLVLSWITDLRRMWPYPADASGDLTFTVEPGGRRAMIHAAGDSFRVVFVTDRGAFESHALEGPAVRFMLRATGHCRLVALAGADEADWVRTTEMLERRGVPGLMAQRAQHGRQLAAYATGIDTPEPILNEAFEWAKVRMDSFLAGTPGVGRSLLGGYGASTRGRDDGRPGFAWYFGQDACWTAMAQLAAGDRDGPRDVLKFLSLSQDVRGKALDQYTTSGLAHYDLADSTPYYLLLVARYAAWTGELDLLARHWVAIRRAYRFCCDGDTSGGGSEACDLNRAACWMAALEGLEPVAEALGYPEIAEEMRDRGRSARNTGGRLSHLWPVLDAWRNGEFETALADWRAQASLIHSAAKGAFGGSSNGLESGGAGGCPDQARSAAMAAMPAIEGLWGVRPDAINQAVTMGPWFPSSWDAMGIERLRVGRSVLNVRLQRRFGQVIAKVERAHGPRIHVEFRLRGMLAPASVLVDDVELGGGRAGFEAEGRHVLIWHE